MDPDSYQQAWRAHASQTRVTIDADLLLKEVQRHQRNFRAMIFRRDFGEVGVAILMLPVWIYMGVTMSLPWTWYLTVPALVWVAVFMLVYRMRHKQKPSKPDEPLLPCVERSLTEQEDQIWLLRNIIWWYLLPPTISLLAFFAHVTWLDSEGWLDALSHADLFVFLFALYYFVYLINQYAVRSQLEPRRQELLTLLTSLRDETTSDETHNRDTALCASPRSFAARFAIAGGALLLAVLINVAADCLETEYPKRSPFAAVRWQQSQPEVRLDDEWFKLVSLDELPASEIVAFSQRTYWRKWRKRFEEDLVELLTRMGHPPQDKVTLVVQSLTSSETWVREDVPMTEENRSAIYVAASKRAIQESQRERETSNAVSIENPEQFRKRIDEFLQLARVKAGFSGVVVVARGGEPVYQGAFGDSHLEPRTRNSLDTPFRIASLSKQFTAAAILSLEAEGKLSVDDPVHRYLSEFSAKPYQPYREITIHHLLSHTSGLPRVPQGILGILRWNSMSRAATPVDAYVRLAVKTPLKFEPGADYQYSNFGYRVLSALIVRVTGKQYADFMEQRLFKPLGLSQSGVARISQPRDEAKVAEGLIYVDFEPGTREPVYVIDDSGRNYGTGYGSGGIYASANDLLRWDRVLAGDSFLSAEQKAKLFRPVREHYACGWIVKKSGLDCRLYQTHSGSNQGYFGKMMRIPEDDLVIIALGNVRKTDEIDDALEQLFRLCRSLPYQDL